MLELPEAETYEQELQYMPYRDSLRTVLDYIKGNAPQNGTLLDLMCGPGYLLGQTAKIRKDLRLKGVDLDQRYIWFASQKYPEISFETGDILKWQPSELSDVVTCTGALHHIPYDKQSLVVERIVSMLKPKGFAIISDCYVEDYNNEIQRKIAAARLGYEYLIETIKNRAPEKVVQATAEILINDVMMREFKTSLSKRMPIFNKFFKKVTTFKTWPTTKSIYGDYIHFCRL